jgi:hypothetical protein
MKFLPAPLCALLVFATLLAGCGGPNTTTVGLKVELVGIARTSDGRTQVTWRLLNPNIVPYLVARATHRISLDGAQIGTVDDREVLAIPAQTNAERTSVLKPAGAGTDAALAAAAKNGSGSYRVETTLVISLFGDTTEKGDLRGAGTVPVTAK